MFSTFTGNSRRPRNVNLSGQAGNPFSNTSWSPAAVSSATKTVSDAQADREKRQAERQRLKAAGQIQRTWRGHRARQATSESRRLAFDSLYTSASSGHVPAERLPFAFNLLLAFFSARHHDDIRRLFLFVRDCETVNLDQIPPAGAHPSRMTRFVQILVDGLNGAVLNTGESTQEIFQFLNFMTRIISVNPTALSTSVDGYYTALAALCRDGSLNQTSQLWLAEAISKPLKCATSLGLESQVYHALTFSFMARANLHSLEAGIGTYMKDVDPSKLARAILDGYQRKVKATSDQLIWLLAHYIHLRESSSDEAQGLGYLQALHVQLSALSPEISLRLREPPTSVDNASSNSIDARLAPLDPYVSQLLLSLVNSDGITRLLQSFSNVAMNSASSKELQATSLLAGYTSTLLQCFPNQADDIRMRLFLTTIPTPEGDIPTVKFLWHDVRRSALFRKVVRESERPVTTLRNYIKGTLGQNHTDEQEEREWRVALMFLELYIFVLRLSDDDDFFSGVNPQIWQSDQPSSRIRSCSLSLDDLTALTTFLKNASFVLYYRANEIMAGEAGATASTLSRIDSYFGSLEHNQTKSNSSSKSVGVLLGASTRLDFHSLRELLSTTMKMLYERDSRKPFLPPGHWLMTQKLEREDFISAVIAEDDRQRREENEESDSSDEEETSNETIDGLRRGFRPPNTYARLERIRINQKRAQRERRLAEMGPKLEILKHMPFVVPFEMRVKIFRQFIHLDRAERDGRSYIDDPLHRFLDGMPQNAKHQADIRRGQLFEDAFDNFYQIGEGLKDTISITFVDQFGTPEAGIDGGGVTKEFLTSVTAEAFSKSENNLNMFTSNEKEVLFPDPMAIDKLREMMRQNGIRESSSEWSENSSRFLRQFEFLGRIIGKCLYEGILVDLVFAGFFLLQWPSSGPHEGNNYKGSVNDLRDMDEELYKGMLRLKNYPGDVAELGLDFTIEDQVSLPGQPLKTVTRNLMPKGDQVPVTNDNRLLYISYVARHRLVHQPSIQTSAFLRGLRRIIRPSWLSMFNQNELQRLVGGDSSEIDVEDLRRNTIYGGVYVIGDDHEEHPTVQLFWKVMKGFTDTQRRDVLKYVSSTPRAPLLGFSQLNPKFSIRDAGRDESRLPSTSTCVNLLKLPQYTTEEVLKEKLLYAVTSGAGFDLS